MMSLNTRSNSDMKCSIRSDVELSSLAALDDLVAPSGDPIGDAVRRHSAKLSLTVFMTRRKSSSHSLHTNEQLIVRRPHNTRKLKFSLAAKKFSRNGAHYFNSIVYMAPNKMNDAFSSDSCISKAFDCKR